MNYDFNEDQKMIKDAARKFLAKECSSEFVREMAEDDKGFTPQLWQGMAGLGWMSLLVPEEYDGFGGGFLDLIALLSEMGYVCLPGPFFSTVVLGGLTILEAGNDAQKAEILPGLAAGERMMTLAWTEEDGLYTPEGVKLDAKLQGDQYILSGTKFFVPDAHAAGTIICAARTGAGAEDITLFLVDAASPGLTINLLETMAGDKQCELVFNEVEVPKDSILGEPNQAWPVLKKILQMAGVAKCAEMIGGAERVMELVVQWAKERIQFGRPVGAFQAVQHHCANMLTCFDTSKFITYQAAWSISAGIPFEKNAAMSKIWVSDSYRKLVALGHQVLGGIAFMEEHDLQLYFKRAKAGEQFFGDADYHREMLALEMGL